MRSGTHAKDGARIAVGFLACMACTFAFCLQACAAGTEGEWLAVRDENLRIADGSALDFTSSLPPLEVGQPVSLQSGLIANQSGERERYFCAPLAYPNVYGLFPDKTEARELAHQLRLMGYNLARFHFVDATLMANAKSDFDFDPEQVDRFHYFLYALKQEGIRWMVDAATSWNGAHFAGKKHFARGKYNLKRDIHLDKAEQEHWKEMVRRLLYAENQYTHSRLIEDPALAVVTLFNEIGVQFNANMDGAYAAAMLQPFVEWQQARGFDTIYDLPGRFEVSARAARMNEFVADLEHKTYDWMSGYLRQLGYRGLVTAYNNGKSLQATAAREFADVVTIHAYHDAPSNFVRKGSRQSASSALDDHLGYFNYFALNRYLGKPYIVDEYDHPYWNPWRREAGLMMGAIGSLQDWDGICRFQNPAILEYRAGGSPRHNAMYPMDIGMDPVSRAGETVAALLYGRRDVEPSDSLIEVRPGDAFVAPQSSRMLGSGLLDGFVAVTELGLGSGSVREGGAAGPAPRVSIPLPYDSAAERTAGSALEKFSAALEQKRKSSGFTLPRFDGRQGQFDSISDTGQVFVDQRRKFFGVISDGTEAFAWDGSVGVEMRRLSVAATGVPAMIAVSSLTGRPIGQSERLLLVVATDAINSGAEFSSDRKKLVELGTLPVRIRDIRAHINLQTELQAPVAAYALALNGVRREAVPVHSSDRGVSLDIALGELEKGPTFYFELVFGDLAEGTTEGVTAVSGVGGSG